MKNHKFYTDNNKDLFFALQIVPACIFGFLSFAALGYIAKVYFNCKNDLNEKVLFSALEKKHLSMILDVFGIQDSFNNAVLKGRIEAVKARVRRVEADHFVKHRFFQAIVSSTPTYIQQIKYLVDPTIDDPKYDLQEELKNMEHCWKAAQSYKRK